MGQVILIMDTDTGKSGNILQLLQTLEAKGLNVVVSSELTSEIIQHRLEIKPPPIPIVPLSGAEDAKLFIHQSPLESLQSNHKRYRKNKHQ